MRSPAASYSGKGKTADRRRSSNETDGCVLVGHGRSARTGCNSRSSSVRCDSVWSARRGLQSGCDIRDSSHVWDSVCSVVRDPTQNQSPYHNHHSSCDWWNSEGAGGTRPSPGNRGRRVRKRPSERST